MQITEEKIREKAYELWKTRGSRQGFASQDWADAEKSLRQLHTSAVEEPVAPVATPAAAPAPAAIETPASVTAATPNVPVATEAPVQATSQHGKNHKKNKHQQQADVRYGLKKMS